MKKGTLMYFLGICQAFIFMGFWSVAFSDFFLKAMAKLGPKTNEWDPFFGIVKALFLGLNLMWSECWYVILPSGIIVSLSILMSGGGIRTLLGIGIGYWGTMVVGGFGYTILSLIPGPHWVLHILFFDIVIANLLVFVSLFFGLVGGIIGLVYDWKNRP